jgi:glycogen debranching enzyme
LIPVFDGWNQAPAYGCHAFNGSNHSYELRRQVFVKNASSFIAPSADTLAPVVTGSLEQACRDLAALRLYDLDRGERAWTVAAGLPVYVALFGRDTLTAAWQASIVSTDLLKGTLAELARWQGRQCNNWRDEQPGRMLHEAHTSPLSVLNFHPRSRYYGATTTSAFYSVALSLLWHWTGDKKLVLPYLDPALKALQWLDRYAQGQDGFYSFKSRSMLGVQNQGWKDSGDAMVYEDGTEVRPPVATCEEQAFVYVAKLHLSELLWWLGRKDEAKTLFHEAGELKSRFNESYWMEKEGFYAMGLDRENRQVRSICSAAGHCIAAGIADESLVQQTAGRLFAPSLFSGWGIRTLSSDHPAYNPYSYHRGSIWPVEHGTFAIGFARYGLHNRVEQISRAQFETASLFDFYRLPELLSGHDRDQKHPFPAFYPAANWPQAWSASTVFSFVQALLGIYPYAPLRMLLVDPFLPEWLPEITVCNLHVGRATVNIRFWRDAKGKSHYKVLNQKGRLHILRQPSPWSLTAGFAERVKDVLTSFL